MLLPLPATACYVLLSSCIVLGSEIEIEPPHDPVEGDYQFDSPNFPEEVPLPFDADKNCSAENVNDKLSIEAYVSKYGYFIETHNTITEDGYFLKIFRINGSNVSAPREGKVPVFLNHGLAGNAWSWIITPSNISLAFKLANEGFDVYLSNARANGYSSGHRTLTKTEFNYWDFSFHELGYYDVPAVIDYILQFTRNEKLYYVGHSLGCMQFFVAMSSRPEYNEKIHVAFLLGAAGYVANIKTLGLRTAVQSVPPTATYYLTVGYIQSFKEEIPLVGNGLPSLSLCFFACGLCEAVVVQQFGYNGNQNDIVNARMLGAKYFGSTSKKVFSHLHQSNSQGTFALYDYGFENLEKYGATTAPSYPLEKITAPIVNYWGLSDEATTPEDIKNTMSKLPSSTLKENNRVALRSFTHMDFLYANDVEALVSNRIVWIMKKKLYVGS